MGRLLFLNKNNGGVIQTERPQEDLMELLIKKTKELGHVVSFSEAKADPGMVEPNTYAYYFDSFGKAAKRAWDRVSSSIEEPKESNIETVNETEDSAQEDTDEESEESDQKSTINDSASSSQETINIQKESPQVLREKEVVRNTSQNYGRKLNYSTDSIKEQLNDFYERKGHLPSQVDCLKYGFPSWGTMLKYLGPRENWSDFIEIKAKQEETKPADNTPAASTTLAEHTESTATKKLPEVEIKDSSENGKVEIHHSNKSNNSVAIEIKIILPDREGPIVVNLTI